jgi:hypothetical protein
MSKFEFFPQIIADQIAVPIAIGIAEKISVYRRTKSALPAGEVLIFKIIHFPTCIKNKRTLELINFIE